MSGGEAVRPCGDWSFGLVDRERRPKAALAPIVADVPRAHLVLPTRARLADGVGRRVRVQRGRHDRRLPDALDRLDYPHVEVIVVDDDSTDDTAARAARYSFVRLIRVPNGGLSAARNIGLHAAAGEIVAYVDADVRVDPIVAQYLVQPFVTSGAVAAGGPNVAPRDDDWFAQCVARAPGAPNHVMFDDRVAEHIPGCNLAVRRTALLDIGGFDPVFLRAGDDVDVCWRLQEPRRPDRVLGRRLWSGITIGPRSPPTGGSRSVTAKAKRGSAGGIATVFRVLAWRGAAASTARCRSSSR